MKYALKLSLVAFLFGCGNPKSADKNGIQIGTKFYSVDTLVYLRKEPSEVSAKSIDEGLPITSNNTEYCCLDNSNKIIITEIKGKWCKVKVIEPDWLTKRYSGWIDIGNVIEYGSVGNRAVHSNLPSKKNDDDQKLAKTEELKNKIKDGIKDINQGDDISNMDLSTLQSINIAVSVFQIYSRLVKEGNITPDKDVASLTSTLRSKVVASQVKCFPRIRKAYFQLAKDRLWENDVYVTISGKGNTILKFTGGYFATNLNIKETQQALQEMLKKLRFKQTQYRWYKGQDEYTPYKIDSNNDSVLQP
ncbi:hypothetical protein ABIB40_000808 [Pedobacter sp. UYP30]|uniref:hypothetical protein n=1 Tax=Pedobacter sp. UYP30 TaxID=1756400 RepID=UPI003392F5EC